MIRYALLFFVLAFALLAWRQSETGVAASYADPVIQMRAQDEAPYADAAIRMARTGDWGTPNFMGRPFLQKPPVLFWLSAACIRILGVSLIAIRLPALLLGALAATAIFVWCANARGLMAGFLAGLLLASSPIWNIFSRLCYTDVPSAAFATLAMCAVALDPMWQRRRTPILFGVFGALSILAKSIAGLLPFAAFGLWWLLTRRRVPIFRIAVAALITLAPWFIYQALTYPQWFWADFVQVQILGVGTQTLGTSIFSRPSTFYFDRLVRLDPVALLCFLIAVPLAIRRRSDPGVLLAALWAAMVVMALVAFQGKSVPYLTMLLPPMCVLAGLCLPAPRIAIVPVAVIFVARLALSAPPPPVEGATAMRAYYALGRANELVSCEPEDEFYSATLPLPRERYCYVDPTGAIVRSVPHYGPLGVVLPLREFLTLDAVIPRYRERLRAWHWPTDEPIGTLIILDAAPQLADLLRARPDLDFCVPEAWVPYAGSTHSVQRLGGHHVYLLSRVSKLQVNPLPPLPDRW